MKKFNLKPVMGIATIVLIVLAIDFLSRNQSVEINGLAVLSFVIAGLFLFSVAVRKSARFKPYFTSRYNIFTSKVRHQQEFDFSKDILFEKFKEVLQAAGFKIVQTNQATGDIFATSPISWFSWGENIYINMKESNGKTNVDFCSACFFQMYSWGKNERNYQNLLHEFEKSLII